MVRDTSSRQDASTHQIWNSYLKEYKRYALDTIIIKKVGGQDHSGPKMVHDTLLSRDESTNQIWNSYLKEYNRYALDTIIIKTRSEVKVTVTRK